LTLGRLSWSGLCLVVILHLALAAAGQTVLSRPAVHLRVGGGEDDHVGHQDDDAGTEHRHDDGQDDVQLAVFFCVKIMNSNCSNLRAESENNRITVRTGDGWTYYTLRRLLIRIYFGNILLKMFNFKGSSI